MSDNCIGRMKIPRWVVATPNGLTSGHSRRVCRLLNRRKTHEAIVLIGVGEYFTAMTALTALDTLSRLQT